MGAAGPRADHYLLLLLMLEFVTIVGGAFCARLAQARAPFGFLLLAVGVLLAATGLTLLVTPWVYACGVLYFTAMSVILTVFLSRPPSPAPDPVPVTEPLTRNPVLK